MTEGAGERVPVVPGSWVWHRPGSGKAKVLLNSDAEVGAVTTVEGSC